MDAAKQANLGLRAKSTYISNYQAGPTWVTVGGTVSIQFMLMDRGAPQGSATRVDMVRAPDLGGRPGAWEVVANRTGGASSSFDLSDQPRVAGQFWYGFHLTDGGNREIREPAPLLVRVASAEDIATAPANDRFPGGTNIILGTPVIGTAPANQGDLLTRSTPSQGTAAGLPHATLMRLGRVIRLTPAAPESPPFKGMFGTPARGFHNYTFLSIDTRDFPQGGDLVIDIEVAPNSTANGSFDLYPPDLMAPQQGDPVGALAVSHGVRIGTSAQIEYHFSHGQIFGLGMEGDRSSPHGAVGFVQLKAKVVSSQ